MLDIEAAIGTVIARRTGAEPVSEVGIRRYLEAHLIDFGPFHDPEAARQAGYENTIAPWSMLLTMAMSAYWKPGEPKPQGDLFPPFAWDVVALEGGEMMTNRVELEFFGTLQLGDIVHSEYRITGVTPKTTRVGVGEFVDFEVSFSNQHGRLIAIERTSVYRYMPHPATEAAQ